MSAVLVLVDGEPMTTKVRIICDVCETSSSESSSARRTRGELKAEGWQKEGSFDFCPACRPQVHRSAR